MLEVNVKRVRPGARLPAYATEGSAAMDLHASLAGGDSSDAGEITLAPMERALVPTGVALALPSPDYVALVFARSGLAIRGGLALSNGVGVIDSDYRGEISVGLVNLSNEAYTLRDGDRIAQLAILPVSRALLREVDALGESERGTGGFGSTGR